MKVAPSVFAAAMSEHWTSTLGNVSSPALRAVWGQLAHTFNRQIAAHGTPEGQRWKVLQPATGTGKSQGLGVFCSMLPAEDHPGVLIVTRLKTQADDMAKLINDLTGNPGTALAYHGDNRVPVEQLATAAVLVITHRAYEIGLDAINRGQPNASNWCRYHEWQGGKRKLVVIDEALDIIEEAQIDLNRVKVTRAVIPFEVAEKFPAQMQAIQTLEELLVTIARMAKEQKDQQQGQPAKERVLSRGELPMPTDFDMTGLRRALKDLRLDRTILRMDDQQANRKLIVQYDTVLKDIETTLSNWSWYYKKLKDHTMNTARLIVPDDIEGACILDATASSNLIYQLFDSKVDVIPVPSNARSYSNVKLHISMGHAVGKTTLREKGKDEAPKLLAAIKDTLGADRKVLVVAHKSVEAHFTGYCSPTDGATAAPLEDAQGCPFKTLQVGHWNALDGRNDFRDCDTVVIFGLLYRDKVWSANTFMALQGLQDNDWLNSEGDRPFQGYRDVRHSLEVGHLVVSVVQAINRVRCRKVTDEQGNCDTTDVFLLLPNDTTGKEIIEGIRAEMPGIDVLDWDYSKTSGTTRKPRKSNHKDALVAFARGMQAGRKAATVVMRELGMSRQTFMNLMTQLKDRASGLAREMAGAGVRYQTDGPGMPAFLVKD